MRLKTKTHPYDRPEKQAARDEMYSRLRELSGGRLLMLAGTRRHEWDTALRVGFTEDRITLVECTEIDNGAANKANFVRQFRKCEQDAVKAAFRTGWLSDVCEQLAREGIFQQVLSLDFCSPIELLGLRSPRVELARTIGSGVLRDGLLAVEVLNGRVGDCESRFASSLASANLDEELPLWESSPVIEDAPTEGELIRLKLLRHAVSSRFSGTVRAEAVGQYTNVAKSSPMLWIIYRLTSKGHQQ